MSSIILYFKVKYKFNTSVTTWAIFLLILSTFVCNCIVNVSVTFLVSNLSCPFSIKPHIIKCMHRYNIKIENNN